MILTTVKHHISAAHRAKGGGPLHGHTWRISVTWVYTGQCAEDLKMGIILACRNLDHNTLPDELARGEDLAQHLGQKLDAHRVEVSREAEGFGAEWVRD